MHLEATQISKNCMNNNKLKIAKNATSVTRKITHKIFVFTENHLIFFANETSWAFVSHLN